MSKKTVLDKIGFQGCVDGRKDACVVNIRTTETWPRSSDEDTEL